MPEEALQTAEKRKEAKGKGEKESYTHLNAEFQRIVRRDKRAFLSDQYKEIEENNRMGKTRDVFKKIRHSKGTFYAKMCTIKDGNGIDLTEAEDIKKRPDGQYQNQTDYLICSQRWSSIQSAKTRPGTDCGSDHELLIAKFRLKLKKVGKTTRPFRYDLNQIPNDYTVEVRNRFKGLDLIDRVPDELWTEVCDIVQETGIKTITKKKKC